jgi:outer membrane protein assembly factor BamB
MSGIRLVVLSLAVLFSIDVAAFAQSVARGGSPLPVESSLNRLGLTRRWWSHATINKHRDKVLYLSVDEKYLFMQSTAGVISTFDCETGKHLWSRAIGDADRAIYPASMNDDTLFVVNGLQLFAVRKETGEILFNLALPSQPSSSPSADAHRMFVGFLDGSLYAFDLAKVRELQRAGQLPQYAQEAVAWRYRTGQAIAAAAVPRGKVVTFASRNGSLYSVSAEDRKLIFQFETDAPLTAPLVRYRNSLLIASEDSTFYSLNMTNGRQGWQFTTGVVIRKSPVLIDDEVYLMPEHGSLYKLSAETGKPRWSQPQFDSFLAASSTRVYAVGHGNQLKVLSRETGDEFGMLPLHAYTTHLTNNRSDRIYVSTPTGLIVCLHELGRDFPRYHLHPERQPVLPEFASEDDAPATDAPAADPNATEELPPSDAAEEAPATEETPPEETPEGESP